MTFLTNIFIFVGLISFVGMAWSVVGLYRLFISNNNNKLHARIQLGHEINKNQLKIKTSFSKYILVNDFLSQFKIFTSFEKIIVNSGWSIDVLQLIVYSLIIYIFSLIFLFHFGLSLLFDSIFALFLCILPTGWLCIKEQNRQVKLENQLPDILDFIARSMQAGHDFNSALRLAAQESPNPISDEFQTVFDEVNFGGSMHASMQSLSKRINCSEIKYFATAVLINREIGGDIANLLSSVATLIRERLTFRNTIYAMTAEGRVSALILGVMPFVLGGLIFIIRPEFVSILWTDETGRQMLLSALLLIGIGFFWMNRLIQIKV